MSAEDTERYRVVVNHEGQYSIWPVHRCVPPGWFEEGTVGSKADCLEHIERVWTDVAPSSVRFRYNDS